MAQNIEVTPGDLAQRAAEAPGKITLVTLLELRSAYQRGRATPGVLERIALRLRDEHQLGMLRDENQEPDQEQQAYLYRLDEPIAQVIEAVRRPSSAALQRLQETAAPADQSVGLDAGLQDVKAALDDASSALEDLIAARRQ